MHLLFSAKLRLHVFVTVYSLAFHAVINRHGSARIGAAIGCKINLEKETGTTSPGGRMHGLLSITFVHSHA